MDLYNRKMTNHPPSPKRGGFYKTWIKLNEIQLTKNKMDVNKQKMRSHQKMRNHQKN